MMAVKAIVFLSTFSSAAEGHFFLKRFKVRLVDFLTFWSSLGRPKKILVGDSPSNDECFCWINAIASYCSWPASTVACNAIVITGKIVPQKVWKIMQWKICGELIIKQWLCNINECSEAARGGVWQVRIFLITVVSSNSLITQILRVTWCSWDVLCQVQHPRAQRASEGGSTFITQIKVPPQKILKI